MREIKAIVRPFMVEHVLQALASIADLPGVTISEVRGWGRAEEVDDPVRYAGHSFAKMAKIELVVDDSSASEIVAAVARAARTGRAGDGKIFEYEVTRAVRVRTGESVVGGN